jgi:hypothetical protein
VGEGFFGDGMVPKGQRPLVIKAKIPAKAAKLVVVSVNDGGGHDPEDDADTKHTGDNRKGGECFDTRDGKGWVVDL